MWCIRLSNGQASISGCDFHSTRRVAQVTALYPRPMSATTPTTLHNRLKKALWKDLPSPQQHQPLWSDISRHHLAILHTIYAASYPLPVSSQYCTLVSLCSDRDNILRGYTLSLTGDVLYTEIAATSATHPAIYIKEHTYMNIAPLSHQMNIRKRYLCYLFSRTYYSLYTSSVCTSLALLQDGVRAREHYR